MLRFNKNGFTIIEVLLSILILSIVITPVMPMLSQVFVINKQIEQENRANFLAEMKMEEMKTKAITYFSFDYGNVEGGVPGSFTGDDSKFKYWIDDNTIYDDSPGTEIINIKEITVTVWYDEDDSGAISGGEATAELRTIVANRGELWNHNG